ncbi:TonB family protein [Flavobacterium procerum]|uniref:TonB family protein n=1 Tax=Flavobacterium procerum TaxID=1455569 RepID=A0ABV6BNT0_9FLAO
MKRLLLCVLSLIYGFMSAQNESPAISSNDKLIYLDSVCNPASKENHKYYRIVKDYYLDKEEYRFEDYYKSGKMVMEGNSTLKDNLSKKGEFICYYENGNKESVCSYEKGRPKGSKTEWYKDGRKKLEGEYVLVDGGYISEFRPLQYWNSEGVQTVVDGNGDYEEIEDNHKGSGKVKNGFKDGVWTGSDKKLKYSYTEIYKNGKLAKGTSIDSLSVEHKYDKAFLMARPANGLEHFYKYIGKNFRIPKSAEGISGKIYLEFVVTRTGGVEKIRVLRSAGYGLDEEAIRLIEEYPEWSSGEIRGIKVKILYSIPITIKT